MSDVSCVYLVGAGNGDPDLLTVKAQRLIMNADMVIYDRLVSPAILDLLPPGKARIFVGKAPDNHHAPFEVVTGVTAATAIGGALGVPLTHRGLSTGVRFVTGHCRADAELDLDLQGLVYEDAVLDDGEELSASA